MSTPRFHVLCFLLAISNVGGLVRAARPVQKASGTLTPVNGTVVITAEGDRTVVDVILRHELQTTWMELCCLNDLANCFELEPGMELLIPGTPADLGLQDFQAATNCSAVTSWFVDGALDSELLRAELIASGMFDEAAVHQQIAVAGLPYLLWLEQGYSTRSFDATCPIFAATVLAPTYLAAASAAQSKHGGKGVGQIKNTFTKEFNQLKCAFGDVFAKGSAVYIHYCSAPLDAFTGKKCMPWPFDKVCIDFPPAPGAVTFGNRIYVTECNPSKVAFSTLAHEMQHVRQFVITQKQVLWDMAYQYMLGWCKAGPNFEGNWMEVEARNVALTATKCAGS